MNCNWSSQSEVGGDDGGVDADVAGSGGGEEEDGHASLPDAAGQGRQRAQRLQESRRW